MQPKSILRSKTIWGVVLAVAPQIVDLAASGALGPKASAAVSLIGGLIATWGRITASRPVRLPGAAPCLLPLIILGLAFAAPGCTTTGRPDAKIVAQLGVSYAVGKVIENNPTYAPRIAEIARHVGAAASGESSTVAAVIDLARAQVDFTGMSPADQTLVNTLLLAVQLELERRIEAGALPPDLAASVREVAGWIETAAVAYLPPAAAP